MIKAVKICGVPYKVLVKPAYFEADAKHFGEIDYKAGTITISDDLSEEIAMESLCHEIVHGMLVHIGRSDLAFDEQFVQALGNAIYQTFDVKGERGIFLHTTQINPDSITFKPVCRDVSLDDEGADE